MTDSTKESLEQIISKRQISTVFQPIVSLADGSILGYEALSRITCISQITNPEMLFAAATMYNHLWELELLCRTTALETAATFMRPRDHRKIFLNMNPNTMRDETFSKGFTKEFLKQYQISPHNLIFEITERNAIQNMAEFRAAIAHYRSQGYEIAIDDAGAGYSGLTMISDIKPNYIKLDMSLIRNIDSDHLKFALVKGMVEASRMSGITLIAEGIETTKELATLLKLGVQYGQGYLIQRPAPAIADIGPTVLQTILAIRAETSYMDYTVRGLCASSVTLSTESKIGELRSIFNSNPDCAQLCVLQEQIPVGIISRAQAFSRLSGEDGSTHDRLTTRELMATDFLSVDCNTPIDVVCSRAMLREQVQLYDLVVVTASGNYLGVVTIRDLLQRAMAIAPLATADKHQPLRPPLLSAATDS